MGVKVADFDSGVHLWSFTEDEGYACAERREGRKLCAIDEKARNLASPNHPEGSTEITIWVEIEGNRELSAIIRTFCNILASLFLL